MKVKVTFICENDVHPTEEEMPTAYLDALNTVSWTAFLGMLPKNANESARVVSCELIER